MLGSEEHANLFLNGLKVTKEIYFLDRRNLHHCIIKNGCLIVNVTMVFNEYIDFPHASIGVDTLSEARVLLLSGMNHRPCCTHNNLLLDLTT